jgi:hypothetical protein
VNKLIFIEEGQKDKMLESPIQDIEEGSYKEYLEYSHIVEDSYREWWVTPLLGTSDFPGMYSEHDLAAELALYLQEAK